jgi:hypothetical protein
VAHNLLMSIEASSASGSIGDSFTFYAKQLDDINERRERLVKASRDVTIASKKVIFAVHR